MSGDDILTEVEVTSRRVFDSVLDRPPAPIDPTFGIPPSSDAGGAVSGELLDRDVDLDTERIRRAYDAATPENQRAIQQRIREIEDYADERVGYYRRNQLAVPQPLLEELGDFGRRAMERYDRLADEAARLAAQALPEVVVRGGSRALGVLGSGAFGLAAGIVEGIYEAGRALSDLALRGAIERITPPPVTPAPPAEIDEPEPLEEVVVNAPRPPRPVAPRPPPVLLEPFPTVTGLPFVDVPGGDLAGPAAAPRTPTTPRPLTLATPLDWSLPEFFTPLLPTPAPTPTPSPLPRTPGSPTSTPGPRPIDVPLPLPGPSGGTPFVNPPNTPGDPCRCGPNQPKKKRKKRKPRSVCYRGTYYEGPNSTRKYRKERIPCQRSKSKSR